MTAEIQFQPGERITHHEYGQGVVLDPAHDGYLRAFFSVGERRVPVASLRREHTRTERILRAVDGSADRGRKAWLSYEAHALPVMESAPALTSAKIDLLPHQVVLTHRIATASPRRYLIAEQMLKAQAEGLRVLNPIPAVAACKVISEPSGLGYDMQLTRYAVNPPEATEELFFFDLTMNHTVPGYAPQAISTLSISTLRSLTGGQDEKIGL